MPQLNKFPQRHPVTIIPVLSTVFILLIVSMTYSWFKFTRINSDSMVTVENHVEFLGLRGCH